MFQLPFFRSHTTQTYFICAFIIFSKNIELRCLILNSYRKIGRSDSSG